MGFLSSKSKSESRNLAYPDMQRQFGSTAGLTGQASSAIANLLGLGGNPAIQEQAFNNFRDASGYDFIVDQGTRALEGGAASRGLLSSGATARALSDYGQNTARTHFNDYLSQLFNLTGQGLGAGQLITQAGQSSKSSSTDNAGKRALAGTGLSMLSDPRMKKDVERIGETSEGIGLYTFRYNWEDSSKPKHTGVMADEVSLKKPEALGKEIQGFLTVDYSKLEGGSTNGS